MSTAKQRTDDVTEDVTDDKTGAATGATTGDASRAPGGGVTNAVGGTDGRGTDGASAWLLETRELARAYGAFVAVDGVDLTVRTGARHALIGPNGAGKTTLLNLIAGTDRPTGGHIVWDGRDVTWHSQRRRFRAGIGRTFQHPSVVPGRTVLDNVVLGAWHGPAARRAWLPRRRARELAADCREILAAVGLAGFEDRLAGDLSHGQRRMIDLATALAGRPRLLLLDEPAAGLTDDGIAALLGALRELPETVAVLLVEHNLDVVAAFATEVTVLHRGRPLATGTPAEVQADEAVREAYLGRRKVAGTAAGSPHERAGENVPEQVGEKVSAKVAETA